MTEITIDDDIAQQVITLAEQEKSTVSAVLRAMLDAYSEQSTSSHRLSSNWVADMGRIADQDTTGVWDSFSSDLSERIS